jgi:hypothetical protein
MQGFHPTKPEERIKYHYFDCFDRRSKSLKTVSYKIAERILRVFYKKKKYPFSKIYHGSTWCALSAACVEYILDFMDKNPSLLASLRHLGVQKNLFPTIIGNSDFLTNVRQVFGILIGMVKILQWH